MPCFLAYPYFYYISNTMHIDRAQKIYDGTAQLPCLLGSCPILSNTPSLEAVDGAMEDAAAAAGVQQFALKEEEIVEQFPDAIVWKDFDYPHIIPHEKLWIFCGSCHLGLPSTQVQHFEASYWEQKIAKGDEYFQCGPTYRWYALHNECYQRVTKFNK